MDKYGSDLELCYECERTLNAYEEVYCSSCQSKVLAEWDPTDADLARRDAMIERGWAQWAALIAGVAVGVLVLMVGLSLLTRDVQAQEPTATITAPYAINGRIYEWPAIGTPEYSHSCSIVKFWEDGSAYATCWEDGGSYVYDPDGDITTGKQPGWYTMSETR